MNKILIKLSSLIFVFSLSGCNFSNGSAFSSNGSSPVDNDVLVNPTFWTGFGTSYSSVLDKILDNYYVESGVVIEHRPQGNYSNYFSNINSTVTTGTLPNMANGYPDHFAAYISSGIQDSLDPYLDAYEEENGVDLIDDYYPQYMVENQTLRYNSLGEAETMGVPLNKSSEILVMNQTFIDYAKAKSDFKMFTTWDEYKVEGPKLIALMNDLYGKYVGSDNNVYNSPDEMPDSVKTILDFKSVNKDNFRLMSWESKANMFITLLHQWGSEYTSYNALTDEYGYMQFNSDTNKNKTIEMMNYFKGLYDSKLFGFPSDMGGISDYSSDRFKENKTMFTVCSSAGLSYNSSYFDISLAPIPYNVIGEGEEAVDMKYVISQGTNLCMFDQGNAKTKQKVFDAIVYLTTGDAQARFSVDTGCYPGSISATESKIYQDYLKTPQDSPIKELYRESGNLNQDYYQNTNENWIKFIDQAFVGSSKIRAEIEFVLSDCFAGNDPASILNTVYDRNALYVPE